MPEASTPGGRAQVAGLQLRTGRPARHKSRDKCQLSPPGAPLGSPDRWGPASRNGQALSVLLGGKDKPPRQGRASGAPASRPQHLQHRRPRSCQATASKTAIPHPIVISPCRLMTPARRLLLAFLPLALSLTHCTLAHYP